MSSFGRFSVRRAGARRNIGIAGRIDDTFGENRLAPGLALGDHAADRAALHDRRHTQPMQERCDARLCHQYVRHPLEHLRIERMTEGLRLGHRRAHRLGARLEFDADAFAIDGVLVPVPGKTFDADLGDVAAEATMAIDQRRARTGARRRQRCRETAGATAHDQHVGFQHDIQRTRGLGDFLYRSAVH